MDIRLAPLRLHGAVTPPPSKSDAHRRIIAAALAGGISTVRNIAYSRDISATLESMSALGCSWADAGRGALRIEGVGGRRSFGGEPLPTLNCGESGSTLRFLIPVALALRGGAHFYCEGRLPERPQEPYYQIFDRMGIAHRMDGRTLTVEGQLKPGDYALPGDVSSQFFTGLLFALPLLDGPSLIRSTTPLESASYVDLTLSALKCAGVPVARSAEGGIYAVAGSQYRPFDAAVEADWSQAAFWYAAKTLGSDLTIRGLKDDSLQGDRCTAALMARMEAPGDFEIDLSDSPDLLPPLAVAAAGRKGGTVHFTGAGRLRIKESDRLRTVSGLLRALGATCEEEPEGLTVHASSFRGGTVDGANDHRIVMAAAIAATASARPVTILGAEAVQKSYPDFFDVYSALGGEVSVL